MNANMARSKTIERIKNQREWNAKMAPELAQRKKENERLAKEQLDKKIQEVVENVEVRICEAIYDQQFIFKYGRYSKPQMKGALVKGVIQQLKRNGFKIVIQKHDSEDSSINQRYLDKVNYDFYTINVNWK